jgi:hypothetical protein
VSVRLVDATLERRRGRPPLYPWGEWADGSVWRIVRGEDFRIPAESMCSALRARAARSGRRVVTRVDGDAIDFQFVPRASEGAVA